MTEERIDKVEGADGSTNTTTTIIRDSEPQRSGSGMWVLLIVLLVAVGFGLWIFNGVSGSEIAKDDAVAEAAADVGNAARQAGDAVQDVADDVTDGQ